MSAPFSDVALHAAALVSATDPGKIGAGRGWFDSGSLILHIRNADDTGWLDVGGGGGAGGAPPAWDVARTYGFGDSVLFAGEVWISGAPGNIGATPGPATNWTPIRKPLITDWDGNPNPATTLRFPDARIAITQTVHGEDADIDTSAFLSHSFLGFTVGVPTFDHFQSPAANAVVKRITVPAPGALIVGVDLYCSASDIMSFQGVLLSDDAGAPANVLAVSGGHSGGGGGANGQTFINTTYRWLTLPLGAWVPAGSYWIGGGTNIGILNVMFDAGGTDAVSQYGAAFGLGWDAVGYQAYSSTTRNHGIRASILS